MDFEERAWEPVHHAAYEGSQRQLEKILAEYPEYLEYQTGEKSKHHHVGYTPLLCAVLGNQVNVASVLVKMKANITATDSKKRNSVEICIRERHCEIFVYFFLNHQEILRPVETLMEQVNSMDSHVAENAIVFIDKLLSTSSLNDLWSAFIQQNFIKVFTKLVQSDLKPDFKGRCLNWILMMTSVEEFREMAVVQLGLVEFLLGYTKTVRTDYGVVQNKFPSRDSSELSVTHTMHDQILLAKVFDIIANLTLQTKSGIQRLRNKGGIPVLLENLSESVSEESTQLKIVDLLLALSTPENFVEKREEPAVEDDERVEVEGEIQGDITEDEQEIDETFEDSEAEMSYDEQLREMLTGLQDEFRGFKNLVKLVQLYDENPSNKMIQNVNTLVQNISRFHAENQVLFVVDGQITKPLLRIVKQSKEKDVQLSCIDSIKVLVLNNPKCQEAAIAENAIEPINAVLKKSRLNRVQLSCSSAMWALAGSNIYRKRKVCDLIGIRLFLDYLTTEENELLHLASEGLSVSCEGPFSKAEEIGKQGGVIPVTRLFRHSDEDIVVGGIRTMRKIVLGIGMLPVKNNQKLIIDTRAHRYLLALMKHGKSERVQIEAALSLSYISIGVPDFFKEFDEDNGFSYAPLLNLLSTPDLVMRSKVGTALACFAFNNIQEQVQISRYRALKYKYFKQMIKYKDSPLIQCNAAYQAIILSKVMEDEDSATCAAEGIKALISLLESSPKLSVPDRLFLCECICRLARSSDGGVAEAMIAIDVVSLLAKVIDDTDDDHLKGTASIALGYLSLRYSGWRKLLDVCRRNGKLVSVMEIYCRPPYKISAKFLQQWKHYREITTLAGRKEEVGGIEKRETQTKKLISAK